MYGKYKTIGNMPHPRCFDPTSVPTVHSVCLWEAEMAWPTKVLQHNPVPLWGKTKLSYEVIRGGSYCSCSGERSLAWSRIHSLLWREDNSVKFQKHPDIVISSSVTDTPSTPMNMLVPIRERAITQGCNTYAALFFTHGCGMFCHGLPEAVQHV